MRLWIGYTLFFIAVFTVTYHYNSKFLDWLRFQSLGTRDYIVDRLNQMFYDIPPHRILMGLFVLSFGSGTVAFLVCLPNLPMSFVLGAVCTVVGWKAPKPIVEFIYQRRVRQFVMQMVDGLSLMSNGMKSGLSVVQSIGVVTQEMPNPIRQELNLVLSENKLGVPLEEAFTNLAKRVQADDVEMFVTSVNILKETGGNLAETFDTISNTIRERVKVETKIGAMTATGLYQGLVVMAIVPIIGFIFAQSDPEGMAPLFNTVAGAILLLVVVMLEVAAFFVIMRITKIDV